MTPWFPGLSESTTGGISRFVREIRFRAEKAPNYQEDAATAIYIVTTGSVRRVKWRAEGSTFVLGTSLPEVLTGSTHLRDAVTNVDISPAMIHSSDIEFVTEIAGFRIQVVHELAAGAIQRFGGKIALLKPESIRGRQ